MREIFYPILVLILLGWVIAEQVMLRRRNKRTDALLADPEATTEEQRAQLDANAVFHRRSQARNNGIIVLVIIVNLLYHLW